MEASGCWAGRGRAALRTPKWIGNLVYAAGTTGHCAPAPMEDGPCDATGSLPLQYAVRFNPGEMDKRLADGSELAYF